MTALAAGLVSGSGAGAVVVLVCLRVFRPQHVPVSTAAPAHASGSPIRDGDGPNASKTLNVPTVFDRLVRPPALISATILAPWTSGLTLLAPVLGVVGRAMRVRAARQSERRRTGEVIEALPEVIDLLLLTTGTGLVLRDAISEVAGVGRPGPLDEALARAVIAGTGGAALADEVASQLEALGEPARPLAAVLTGGLRYGSPVVAPLERLVHDARLARRRRAETQARRLPVLLLLPLVFCGLPSFVLLAVVPVALSALDHLSF